MIRQSFLCQLVSTETNAHAEPRLSDITSAASHDKSINEKISLSLLRIKKPFTLRIEQ